MPKKKKQPVTIAKSAVVEQKPATPPGHLAALWFTIVHVVLGSGILAGLFAKVGCHTKEGVVIHGLAVAIKLVTDALVVTSYHRHIHKPEPHPETPCRAACHDEWTHGEPPF